MSEAAGVPVDTLSEMIPSEAFSKVRLARSVVVVRAAARALRWRIDAVHVGSDTDRETIQRQ
jgi:hypothetical protein